MHVDRWRPISALDRFVRAALEYAVMRASFVAAVAMLLVLSLTSCARYLGDGHLVDRGWRSYSTRYVLDLGKIDLASPASVTFTLRGLPRGGFHAGIEFDEPDAMRVTESSSSHVVVVRMDLMTSEGAVVIREEAPLSEWTRMHAMGAPASVRMYRRGVTQDEPLSNGDVKVHRIDVQAHGGWGTYFQADPRVEYLLRLTIVESDLPDSLDARVTLHGG